MATLATVYNRFAGTKAAMTAGTNLAGVADREFALRPLPNEDIYLFVKEMDNGRVVRQADPKARVACWRFIMSGALAVTLLIGILLPSAAARIAGYQMESLRQEQKTLLTEKANLELEEARLLSPERLEEIARLQHFVDPGPRNVVYLNGKGGALAMNLKR
jgi:cell division protein FtsL